MAQHVADINAKIAVPDQQRIPHHSKSLVGHLLAAIPGVGPINAIAMMLSGSAKISESGRQFAAWLGLMSREHSMRGKRRMASISKAGNERFVAGAGARLMAMVCFATHGRSLSSNWLLLLLERKPRKLVPVVPGYKMDCIICATMARKTPVAVSRSRTNPHAGAKGRGRCNKIVIRRTGERQSRP